MTHVYLAPHLDDAVLSCGGAIHHCTAAGQPVLVITLFAGEPEGPPSPFALQQHGYWGHPPRPMALRRAEDAAALARLGAEILHLYHLDAVYRSDGDGRWLYANEEAIFGELQPGDPLAVDGGESLANQLAGCIPLAEQTVVYAPLGVGRHVDHQLTHLAARTLMAWGYRLAFYEDYPYSERPGALDSALAGNDWQPEIISLDAADLVAKVVALAYYRSQLAILFGGEERMWGRVWAFAASRSPEARFSERIWWLVGE